MTSWANLPGAQKRLITLSVMLVTIMQMIMRRVRPQPVAASDEPTGRVEPLPTAVE